MRKRIAALTLALASALGLGVVAAQPASATVSTYTKTYRCNFGPSPLLTGIRDFRVTWQKDTSITSVKPIKLEITGGSQTLIGPVATFDEARGGTLVHREQYPIPTAPTTYWSHSFAGVYLNYNTQDPNINITVVETGPDCNVRGFD